MQYRTLGNTGLQISVLGFGGSPLGGVFGEIDEREGTRAVHEALDLGVNFFDTAPYYGLTRAEAVLGRALRGVQRDRYTLATKVGRYGSDAFDFSAGRVTASVDESLRRLGVDYVDLIQCHDIEFGSLKQVVEETLPALRQLQAEGKARFVGISGYPLKIFRYVLDRVPVDTILSYCRYSLTDTALASDLPYLEAKQVGIISASPLAMGLLTDRGEPAWHPAPAELKEKCRLAAEFCSARGGNLSQLALQFALSHPSIATTLVGMKSPEEVRQNAAWAASPPDLDLLAEVQAILAPVHGITWPTGRRENAD